MTVKQKSSSTPSTPPTPHSVSICASLGLQTLPHVFVLLCCWRGCRWWWWWFEGLLLCWTPANNCDSASYGHQSVSKYRLSDQIKYLTYNLYIFFSVSLFLLRSLPCLLPSTGRLWDMSVRGTTRWLCDYTVVKTRSTSVIRRIEQSGEQGTENEKKRVNFSLAAVTYSLGSWVGSALIIPHINNPNSDWLVSPRQAVTWLPTGQRSGRAPAGRLPPLQEGGRDEPARWAETPLLHTLTTLYNSRLKQSRAPFLYCMLGRG